MKRKTYFLTACLLAGGLGLTQVQAQQSVQAAGGNASGPGGSMSYTLGQVAYLSASGTTGSSSAGMQQPFEFFVLSTTGPDLVALECSTYPNPTAAGITLRVAEDAAPGLSWHLTDLTGRHLQGRPVGGALSTISLTEFPAGAYLLTVERGTQPLKTFKIIKH